MSHRSRILGRWVPKALSRRLVRYTRWPLVGFVRFGDLRRTTPLVGHRRTGDGPALDRHYVGLFFSTTASDLRGRVLWVGNGSFIPGVRPLVEQFTRLETLEDVASMENASSGSFDCIVCIGDLERAYDPAEAIDTLETALRPGGVLLATLPGTSTPSTLDGHRVYWGFTSASVRRLFEGSFPADRVCVEAFGNVHSAVARLQGLGPEDLAPEALEHVDADYPLVITVRARKPEAA